MRQAFCDLVKMLGFVAIIIGIGLFSIPLALVVGGVLMVKIGSVTKIPTVILNHREDDDVR